MKKSFLLITSLFLIGACSQSEQEASSQPESMVEYTWMKAGPNFSAQNLAG